MTPMQEKTSYILPEAFCGTWAVQSYKTPDGRTGTGEDKDRWRIRPQSIICGNSKVLIIKQVESRVEENQDLHLVSFNNNKVQFAFLRSFSNPDDLLVIEYINGEEKLRCLLVVSDLPGP